jgi:sulfonate transport system substrate-binding protein
MAYMLGNLPAIVGMHKQFFEKEFEADSIAIVYKRFDYGPPVLEAFNAGELDFSSMGDQPAIIGWARGIPFKVVGSVFGDIHHMQLLVPGDSPFNSFSELKGKKIAVNVGSNIQHLFNLYLKQNGWKQSDVNLVNLQFSDCITALSAHEIDATLLPEPFASIAIYKSGARIIPDTVGLKYTVIPIVASNEFIEKYPDIVSRVLKVYRESADWAKANREEATDILLKEENNLLPREIDSKLIDRYLDNHGLDSNAIAALGETYRYLRETNVIRKELDIKTLYNTTFEEEAEKK